MTSPQPVGLRNQDRASSWPEHPMLQPYHSLLWTVQCVCTCVRACTYLHTCAHRRRLYKKGLVCKALAPPPGCHRMAWPGYAMLYSLPPSLLRALRETRSSGTQKGRDVTGQLSRSTTHHKRSKTEQEGSRENGEQEKKSKKERFPENCLRLAYVPWQIPSHQERSKPISPLRRK